MTPRFANNGEVRPSAAPPKRAGPPAPDDLWLALSAATEPLLADPLESAALNSIERMLDRIQERARAHDGERAAAEFRELLSVRCTAGLDGIGEDGAKVESARSLLTRIATARGLAPTRAVPLASERILERIGLPPLRHIETGIPALDKMTRGGLLAGRLTVIGGAPDAGKTSLAVQIGHRAARSSFAVAIHCVDEDREGIESRIGQFYEIPLHALEEKDAEALQTLAHHLEALPHLLIIDQDDDEFTIEDSAATLVDVARTMPDCRGMVLIVDSLQTSRSRTSDKANTAKDRADNITATLKAIAKRTGAAVIVTSELGRGAYRSQRTADHIDPMAAFKESGAIEYAMNTGLVLTSVKGRSDVIDVAVPKNKKGIGRAPFWLKRAPDRCTYEEIPREATQAEGARRGNQGPSMRADVELARTMLLKSPGIKGTEALVMAMGINRTRGFAAVRILRDSGELANKGTKARPRLYLVPSTPQLSSGDDHAP